MKRPSALASLSAALLLVTATNAVRAADAIYHDDFGTGGELGLQFVPDESFTSPGYITDLDGQGRDDTFNYHLPNGVTWEQPDVRCYFDLGRNEDGGAEDRVSFSLTRGSSVVEFSFEKYPWPKWDGGWTDLGSLPYDMEWHQTDAGFFDIDGTEYLQVYMRGDNGVPEPAFYQFGVLLALGGVGLMRLRKRT